MCTGKCARCIGVTLYPLAVISIICNIILFFPNWETQWAMEEREGLGNRITQEVKYMGGVIGGGIMVLIPAIHIHLTGKEGCCANRCGMFLSIAFAAVGVAGALYSFIVAILGLVHGPTCMIFPELLPIWTTPFTDREESYLSDSNLWSICKKPENVVEFNLALFSILLVVSSLELILCAFQMVNGLFGCLCGTCRDKGPV
ncbi:transmembrane 4 L6 family member 1 [Megalops cyprinoides]|uniref:transmembrane 4 L6 family member 1 n=1 Tax=Megalops cyprinoides TaxID=118141 RepID=UPI001863AC04|nr:transmembrane 4 L6 family member 1 [Megalops cyprinoides]